MRPVLNLTLHKATPDQVKDGVHDLSVEDARMVGNLIVFTSIEDARSHEERYKRAAKVAGIARDARYSGYKPPQTGRYMTAMIGGAPWLQGYLEGALKRVGIEPVYSFSMRDKVEEEQEDGSVRKSGVFRYLGMIRPHDYRMILHRDMRPGA